MKNIFILFLFATLLSCNQNNSNKSKKPYLVSTTMMIHDIVVNLTDTTFNKIGLMGPGVDPHYYKVSQGDISKLQKADLILFNGLKLEGKMSDILDKLKNLKPTVAVCRNMDKSSLLQYGDESVVDPHVWHDVSLWINAVEEVYVGLIESFPIKKELFTTKKDAYINELKKLDLWAKENIQSIPEKQRIMITSHDAFEYFSKAYNIRVKSLQGVSTTAEFGLKDVTDLIDYIIKNEIKSVFTESSIPAKYIESVIEGCEAKGYHVTIGGYLFSDSLDELDKPAGTYVGMIQHNVKVLTSSLK